MTRRTDHRLVRALMAWWQTYVHEPGAYPVHTIPDAEEALSELMALAVEEE